jgi:hypothetical protein
MMGEKVCSDAVTFVNSPKLISTKVLGFVEQLYPLKSSSRLVLGDNKHVYVGGIGDIPTGHGAEQNHRNQTSNNFSSAVFINSAAFL